MSVLWLICLGLVSGAGAGLLAGLIGIGGGIVIVPVMYYGLISAGASADQAAHVAVATSLAAILPAALASSFGHWRAGNTDMAFLREWGPGIALGVVTAQLVAPHLRGSVMTGIFGLFTLMAAVRFAAPQRFKPVLQEPPNGNFRRVAGLGIGLVSGFAGVGGGIMTNVVMAVSGVPMHKSIRPSRSGRRRRRPARDTRRGFRLGAVAGRRFRLHQPVDVGLHRAGTGGRRMVRR